MLTLKPMQVPEFKKLNLKGIEILETVQGNNNTDFKAVAFRDTVTDVVIRVQMSPYSDFQISGPTPKEFITKYIVSWTEKDGMRCERTFDDRAKAETASSALTDEGHTPEIIEEKVEKEA